MLNIYIHTRKDAQYQAQLSLGNQWDRFISQSQKGNMNLTLLLLYMSVTPLSGTQLQIQEFNIMYNINPVQNKQTKAED